MKKLVSAILMVALNTAFAWADTPATGQTATQLSVQAQQMVALGVPAEAAAKMQNCFQERHMVEARNIIQASKQLGLPVDPVVDKAMEGIAKKVAARNIVNAMEQVRGRYAAAMAAAQQMTQTQTRQQTMTRVMAHAMAAGMPPEDVSAVARQVQQRQRTMAREAYDNLAEETCKAARDMARMGATSNNVRKTLSLALQNKYSARQMSQMRNQFMQQARNTSPDVVASQFQAQVRAGHDVGKQGFGANSNPGSGSAGSGSGQGPGGGGSGNGGSGGSGGSGGNGGKN